MNDDRHAIEQLLRTYFDAANDADASQLASLYTDDAVLLPAEFPTASGRHDIEAFYSGAFSQLQLQIELDLPAAAIAVHGDVAHATTSSAGTRTIRATGDVIPENNRELWVLARTGDDWKIARYMFNKSDTMR